MLRRLLFCLAAAATAVPAGAGPLPPGCGQMLLGVARGWDDSQVTLNRFERVRGRWQPVGRPWAGRLGKSGLVWGLGLHPVPAGGRLKEEGDGRAPAGVFAIGGAIGLCAPDQVARRKSMPYTRIGPRDLWVEDASSPYYNQHLRLPYDEPRTPWEKKQQMKLNDPAHVLKLFIAHNAPPRPVPGAGSAIFLHVWRRAGALATTGCTTMPELRLREVIAWLDPGLNPVYVLLPRQEYARYRQAWGLP